MNIIKLKAEHLDGCSGIWSIPPYWNPIKNEVAGGDYERWSRSGYGLMLKSILGDNYLNLNLDNFGVWGISREGVISSIIYYYSSIEEPAWYLLGWRRGDNVADFSKLWDRVLEIQEENGRYKFYALEAPQHISRWRGEAYSRGRLAQYGVIDEYLVPQKTMCRWTNPWELLFKRVLIAEDTQISCYYLKQEYRDVSGVIGGNL